jgi:hypothetical protein
VIRGNLVPFHSQRRADLAIRGKSGSFARNETTSPPMHVTLDLTVDAKSACCEWAPRPGLGTEAG